MSSQAASADDSELEASLHVKVMNNSTDHISPTVSPPHLPVEIVQLIMDQLYNGSLPQDHCYRNQTTYRNWSLVSHSWRPYAQTLLFRIPTFRRLFGLPLSPKNVGNKTVSFVDSLKYAREWWRKQAREAREQASAKDTIQTITRKRK